MCEGDKIAWLKLKNETFRKKNKSRIIRNLPIPEMSQKNFPAFHRKSHANIRKIFIVSKFGKNANMPIHL